MTYTVLTRKGFLYVFSIKELADTYVQAYGGVVFTQQILETVDKTKV
jgi:hypothetical protein